MNFPKTSRFIHAQEALDRYPKLGARDRENALARQYGAVFIIGIGGAFATARPHDGRAPDYDDWSTPTTRATSGTQRGHTRLERRTRAAPSSFRPWAYGSIRRPLSASLPYAGRRRKRLGLSTRPVGGKAAPYHRRRHRPVAALHALPSQGPHRRDTGGRLAGRHAARLRGQGHSPALGGDQFPPGRAAASP